MKVSVLMCTYNQEKYVAKAIESVMMQKTDFDYELVIGEDFSTDKTREICIDYKKKYKDSIKLILNKKNLGGNPNFIQIFDEGIGEYVALCDGDDYWTDPYKLKKQTDFLDINPDYGLVHTNGDFYYVVTNKRISMDDINNRKNYNKVTDVFSAILQSRYYIITSSVLLRNRMMKKVLSERKKAPLFEMGDTPIWLEFCQRTKIYYLNESMVCHNILEESIEHSNDFRKKLRFCKSTYEMKKYYIKKFGASEETKNIVDFNYNRKIFYLSFFNENKIDVKNSFNTLKRIRDNNKKIPPKYYILYVISKSVLLIKLTIFIRKLLHKLALPRILRVLRQQVSD